MIFETRTLAFVLQGVNIILPRSGPEEDCPGGTNDDNRRFNESKPYLIQGGLVRPKVMRKDGSKSGRELGREIRSHLIAYFQARQHIQHGGGRQLHSVVARFEVSPDLLRADNSPDTDKSNRQSFLSYDAMKEPSLLQGCFVNALAGNSARLAFKECAAILIDHFCRNAVDHDKRIHTWGEGFDKRCRQLSVGDVADFH